MNAITESFFLVSVEIQTLKSLPCLVSSAEIIQLSSDVQCPVQQASQKGRASNWQEFLT